MRVRVIGETESARSVRSTLGQTDVVVSNSVYDLTINVIQTRELLPTIDSVDSELERQMITAVSTLAETDLILKRPGGIQDDNYIEIGIPEAWGVAMVAKVEHGIARALIRLSTLNADGSDPAAPVGEQKRPWWKILSVAVAALALSQASPAQNSPIWNMIGSYTTSTLPAANIRNRVAVVTNAASAVSCTVGGGSTQVLCRDTGSAWAPLGDGGGAGGGTGDVLGGTNLLTTGTIAFTAAPATVTEDAYFTYVPWPGSPVGGNSFNSLTLTDSGAYTDPYLDGANTSHGFYFNKGLTALPFTPTSQWTYYNQAYNYLALNPSSSWNNAGVLRVTAAASRNSVLVKAASTQPIYQLLGIQGMVDNQGSGDISAQYAMSWNNYHEGTGTVAYLNGMYVYNSNFGYGPATTMIGSDAYSGNDGYGAFGVTTNTVGRFSVQAYGAITTSYALRTLKNGSGTITTAWDIAADTGGMNRLQGKTAIGPSNSSTPSQTLFIKDATATTGATSVLVDIGASQTNTSTVFTLNGVMKLAGENTTGAGSAALGANSPAITNTAPYTWARVVTSDGSTGYVPIWK